MHVRGGAHAITYTNLAPQSHTYARDTCKFSDDSDILVDLLRRNPDDLRASDRLPNGNEVQHPLEPYGLLQS